MSARAAEGAVLGALVTLASCSLLNQPYIACDPTASGGCTDSSLYCVLGVRNGYQSTYCGDTGSGDDGSSCSSSTDCAASLACVNGHCRSVCHIDTGRGCDTGDNYTCVPAEEKGAAFGFCCPATGC